MESEHQDCHAPREFRVTFPGPISHHLVVVDGWSVPFLQAQLRGEDRVQLILDDRIGIDLDTGEADRLIPFLADAIAIALGYGAHPREEGPGLPPKLPPVAPRRVTQVEMLPR
jgi:hypothetical protein